MPESYSSTIQKYLEELKLLSSSMALVAIVVGLILFLMWRRTGIPRHLVAKERIVRVPWDWLEVFLAMILMILLFGAVVETAPWGKYKLPAESYSGFQLGAAASVTQASVDAGLSGGLLILTGAIQSTPDEIARMRNDARIKTINSILFFPITLLLLFNLMPRLSGAKFYQMGLHINRWRENFTLGVLGWAIITPICTIVFLIVSMNFWETLWGRGIVHPMHTVLMQDENLSTWLLVGLATCIVAPLSEEILMRGIMQPYLVRNAIMSDVILVLAIAWAFASLITPGTGPDRGLGMGPLFFVATIAPGYYLFEKWTQQLIKEPGAARGIYVTSLIFAYLHGHIWPSPIPLFFFSLGVGFLAYRTRSLIGPITVHVLFNLTTMIILVLGHYPRFKW